MPKNYGLPDNFILHENKCLLQTIWKFSGGSRGICSAEEIEKNLKIDPFDGRLKFFNMMLFRSAKNTGWCLFGCALGDLGTIAGFQNFYHPQPIPQELWAAVWVLAMTAGICTSVL